jgi:hypothetical protein
MIAALDEMIAAGTGGRTTIALRQVCQLMLRVGFEDQPDMLDRFDELMSTLAMDLDDTGIVTLAPELERMPGILPAFSATMRSRFHEIALRNEPKPIARESVEAHADDAAPPQPTAEARKAAPAPLPRQTPPPRIERRATPRDAAQDADNPITLARRASPDQLAEIALLPTLPEVLTGVLASRGHIPAIVTALRNPGARFNRATFVMLAELGVSDRPLWEAMLERTDLPSEALGRLKPAIPRAAA